MPVLKWNHPPTPREDTQRRLVPAVGHGEHVAVQAQAFGDPVAGTTAFESVGDHIQPATLFSTAPYQPEGLHSMDGKERTDKPRTKDRRKRCTAMDDTCMGWETQRWPGLCAAHGRLSETGHAWPQREVPSSTSTD